MDLKSNANENVEDKRYLSYKNIKKYIEFYSNTPTQNYLNKQNRDIT